jgi:hypothetical protein
MKIIACDLSALMTPPALPVTMAIEESILSFPAVFFFLGKLRDVSRRRPLFRIVVAPVRPYRKK